MKFFATALAPWALVALASVSSVVAMPGLVERQSTSSTSATTVSPLTPSTTPEGSPLMIQWDTTTNQAWKSMEIKFMTGSNQNMTELYTVATGVDGTSAGAGQLLWTAPNVNPNANIYFFQFTHGGADPTWTTRFAIADASGATTAPPFARQPEGPAIPWGNGRIVSATSAAASSGSSSSSASASGSSASVSASASASSASSSASSSMATSASRSSSSAASSSTSGSSASQTSGSSSGSSSSTSSASTTVRVGSAAMLGCVVAALAGTMLV